MNGYKPFPWRKYQEQGKDGDIKLPKNWPAGWPPDGWESDHCPNSDDPEEIRRFLKWQIQALGTDDSIGGHGI